MKQKPFTTPQINKLRSNAEENGETGECDHAPVVKFFCPWGPQTWLITEAEDVGHDMRLFGLCDLGFGCPELGYVMLSELTTLKGPFGLTIERDMHFSGDKPISEYAEEARSAGRIAA